MEGRELKEHARGRDLDGRRDALDLARCRLPPFRLSLQFEGSTRREVSVTKGAPRKQRQQQRRIALGIRRIAYGNWIHYFVLLLTLPLRQPMLGRLDHLSMNRLNLRRRLGPTLGLVPPVLIPMMRRIRDEDERAIKRMRSRRGKLRRMSRSWSPRIEFAVDYCCAINVGTKGEVAVAVDIVDVGLRRDGEVLARRVALAADFTRVGVVDERRDHLGTRGVEDAR